MTSGKFIRFIVTGGFILLLFVACKNPGNNKEAATTPLLQKDTAAVSALIKKANTFTQTNFDSLRYYAKQAYDIAVEINFAEGMARAIGIEANYQRRKGNYEGAITTGLKAVQIFDSLRLWKRLVKLKSFLADIYKEMGGEKGTVEYLQKGRELAREALAVAEREKYIDGIAMCLNEEGIILRDMSSVMNRPDLLDSAYNLYKKGVDLVKFSGEGEDNLGALYNNIAQILNEHYKDYDKALDYQVQAVVFNNERNNQASLTYNYNTISEIYINKGDLKQAEEYAHRMLALAIELKVPFRMVDAYGALTKVNKTMGRYDSALYYHELETSLSDSINNLEKSSQIAEMQTKYETGKKEEQIGTLSQANKAKSQRLLIMGAAAGLLLLLLSIVWLQKRKSQQQKQKISQQSEKLQWMMKELHHRVKNNLQIVSSLLNLQTYRLKDEESISAIKESQLRVQAMSLMHQRLYQVEDVSMVNFKLYLDDLVDTLMKAYGYGSDDFDLTINIEKEFLDVDTVMPMGLLVNEIVTNSFKYAYKEVVRPSLSISMCAIDKQLELKIADNGPGMVEIENSTAGFGKKLIGALTQQLKATYSVSNTNGTSYTIAIPYNDEKAA